MPKLSLICGFTKTSAKQNDPPVGGSCVGSGSRARTYDTLINSQVLCQLSYPGMCRNRH